MSVLYQQYVQGLTFVVCTKKIKNHLAVNWFDSICKLAEKNCCCLGITSLLFKQLYNNHRLKNSVKSMVIANNLKIIEIICN